MSRIGPTFGDELAAAGLRGIPITWTDAGAINGRDALTKAQNKTLDKVIATHDPEALDKRPLLDAAYVDAHVKSMDDVRAVLKAMLKLLPPIRL